MVEIVTEYFHKIGVKKLKSNTFILNNIKYKWYQDNPFILYQENSNEKLDIFNEVMRIPEFKKEYNKKCEHELDELFDIDDKEFYDVILDHYQQMPRCENEVQNFLNNYEILKVQSPMATKKSNVIEEVLKQAKKQNKKCLFITNRRSLANDISEKYKISNYQNPYFYNDPGTLDHLF